jgi:hypothetical protein
MLLLWRLASEGAIAQINAWHGSARLFGTSVYPEVAEGPGAAPAHP